MAAPTTQARLDLLEAAFDAGITHFDTAAYYGYGEAERLLGKFLSRRRDKVTITTKFGIQPSGVIKYRWVNLAARHVVAFAPFVKRLVRRDNKGGARWGVFDPEQAATSLDRSLAALKTDYIDLFLMHEPSPESACSGALLDFLEREVTRGRIRAYGCGGEWQRIQKIVASGGPASRWLQFEDNAVSRHIEEARSNGANCITFAPFNSALEILMGWLAANPERLKEWSKALDLDCRDRACVASLLQASCHARNPQGIVLFSSKQVDRIQRAAQIAGGQVFSTEQVDRFLELTMEVSSYSLPE